MYKPPVLVVDGLVFRFAGGKLEILLIKRRTDPFKNCYALPGGYVNEGQTTREAFDAILSRKAGLGLANLSYNEQLYTFDTVARDPRGHAVSVSYLGVTRLQKPKASAKIESPSFYSIDNLPELAFDHADIISYARERLQSKLTYTNIAVAFLPTKFTLSQLQQLYEQIIGHPLDKRNFRKQIKSQAIVSETDEWFKEGRHRPAKYYEFTSKKVSPISF